MTTPESPVGGPPEPHPAYSQQPPAPTYPGATATLPQLAQPNKPVGLAVAALIVGIVAFLVGLIPVFGALVGIAAIVLGILALRRQQSKGMAIAGIILGSIATLASISMTFGIGAAVNNASVDNPSVVIAESASPKPEESKTPIEAKEPVESKEPAEAKEPVETKAPEPEAAAVPAEYKSALAKAKTYSDMMHMSKLGLYEQLTSEYGEQFSAEAGQYAIDNVKADWNANALAKAKVYQDSMSMSPAAIHDQLTSEYGEQFTVEQADYAIQHLND